MKRTAIVALALVLITLHALCADPNYKQVLVFTNAGTVRVRLPLTDVSGKVRVKEMSPSGFGIPVLEKARN